jgi:hypothetical protein
MQDKSRNVSYGSSADRSREWSRNWRWVLALTFLCVLLALLYQVRPKFAVEQVINPPASDSSRTLALPKQEKPFETEKRAIGTHIQAPPQPVAEQGDSVPGVLQTNFWQIDQNARGKYLHQADLAAEALHLESLGEEEQKVASEALVELVNEVTEPARLQALHLLLNWSKLDEETLARTVQNALTDADESFAGLAVAILTSRTDEQAARVLTQAYRGADAKGRLAIVQLVQVDSLAAPLLQQARNDPDTSVRSAAIANLKTPPRVTTQSSQ